MDKATLAEARGYAEHWQEVLGLQNWQVEFKSENEPTSNSKAHANWAEHYRSAVITINIGHKDISELRRDMLHEVIHLLYSPIENVISDETAGVTKRLLREAQETVVDELTNIIWRLSGNGAERQAAYRKGKK